MYTGILNENNLQPLSIHNSRVSILEAYELLIFINSYLYVKKLIYSLETTDILIKLIQISTFNNCVGMTSIYEFLVKIYLHK